MSPMIPRIIALVSALTVLSSFLPKNTHAFVSPSRITPPTRSLTALAVKTGGTQRNQKQQTDEQQNDTNPKWNQKVKADRPFLGHVVPKNGVTRQQLKQQYRPGKQIRPQGQFLSDGQHPRKTKGAPPLRILGGTCKGRRLNSPLVHLRPMMGKVREACFSTLTYFELYKPPTGSATTALCRHLDIFAGSGSVGLESLSRGATHCTFVDLAPNCCDTIESNLELCRMQDKAEIVCADALELLNDPVSAMNKAGIPVTEPPQPYQIVTLCPPYEEVVYGDLIDAVSNSELVTDDTIVLIEYPIELGCLPHVYDLKSGGKMIGLRNRRYGRTVVALYIVNPTGKLEGAESRPEEFVSLD